MYLAKTMTLRSLPEIGRRFGGRDHTTVLHAVRKIEGLVAKDTALADEVELLKRQLQEYGPRSGISAEPGQKPGKSSRFSSLAPTCTHLSIAPPCGPPGRGSNEPCAPEARSAPAGFPQTGRT
jgi:hypothetical protein